MISHSLTAVDSDEHVEKRGSKPEHDSEDDLDSHREGLGEGLGARRVQRDGY